MTDTTTLQTRNAPRLKYAESIRNGVRVYRASPEDVELQIRMPRQFFRVALTFDEAREIANRLLQAVEGEKR